MPLFFLLSGYVTQYSKDVRDIHTLGRFALKRAAAYLVPWLVWSIFVRGIIFGQTAFLDFKYLLWHMDSGYWFLISLWMIVLAFGISQFVASKFAEPEQSVRHLIITGICFAICALILLGVGLWAGLTFLGIKLTVYYMPFYAIGMVFGKLQNMNFVKRTANISDAVVTASCVVYFILIIRFDLFSIGESISGIGGRFLASLTGCAALCGLLGKALIRCGGIRSLNWVGTHSLELYLVHYLLLCMVKPEAKLLASLLSGLGVCALNYGITVILSVFFVWMLHQNRILRKILFWK